MRNQRGITLIALVITIIVLLILAGVSIAMLTGDNGILTKSRETADETKLANGKELAETDLQGVVADWYDEKYVNNSSSVGTLLTYATNNFSSSDNSVYKVTSGKVTIEGFTEEQIVGNLAAGTDANSSVKITWSGTLAD